MIFPTDGMGGPPGPEKSADMLILIVTMMMLLIRRRIQDLKIHALRLSIAPLTSYHVSDILNGYKVFRFCVEMMGMRYVFTKDFSCLRLDFRFVRLWWWSGEQWINVFGRHRLGQCAPELGCTDNQRRWKPSHIFGRLQLILWHSFQKIRESNQYTQPKSNNLYRNWIEQLHLLLHCHRV